MFEKKVRTFVGKLMSNRNSPNEQKSLRRFSEAQIERVRRFMDANWYISSNSDINFAHIDPAIHYLESGELEGRRPHLLFDKHWYSSKLPQNVQGSANLLIHYLESSKPRSPHPLFDDDWYLEVYPDVRNAGANPLEHYILHGSTEGRQPHPLFDNRWYIAHNGDYVSNPLVHYLQGLGTNPHPLFDEIYYKNQIKDLDYDGIPLLLHFVIRGADAGYNPNPLFDCAWYVSNHEMLAETKENPLAHFVRRGIEENRDPHPSFNVDWYLYKNPDVAADGINPLQHYLSSGMTQNRSIHPPGVLDSVCPVLSIPYEILRRPRIGHDSNICLFVTYSPSGKLSSHVELLIEEFHRCNFDVILIVATDGLDSELSRFTDNVAGLIVRSNHGWDFAAWAVALAALPDIWNANSVILTNDSIFGATDSADFSAMIERIHKSNADFVALTESFQVRHHLMSYFTVMKRGALKSQIVRDFWANVQSFYDKNIVINHYEMSSLDLVRSANITHEVLFPIRQQLGRSINPTLDVWFDLLNIGFPFLKVQLVRDKARLMYSQKFEWRSAIGNNARLISAVNEYLEAYTRRQQVYQGRPVPSPRRRFKRASNLHTFYGAVQSTRPTEATDLCLEVPFRFDTSVSIKPQKVAVVAHIFYTDMCTEIISYLDNIPISFDLFVSTDTSEKKSQIEQAFSGYLGKIEVKVFPNRGRDIAPMLVGYASVFYDYDSFLHIHSKKSLHTSNLAGWRKFLLDNLLGSKAITSSVLYALGQGDVGLVFSDHFSPVRSYLNWGGNYERIKSLLEQINISVSQDLALDFPSSSFFWGKTDILKPLVDLGLTWDDFEPEDGQIDGTLAHAIERSLVYLAEASGHSWAKVGTADHVSSKRLVPVWDFKKAFSSVEQHLLHNRLPPLKDRSYVPAVVSVSTKPNRTNERPRLNLVIPSLTPEHIYGGIATALRLFHEVADEFGGRIDLRILCQSAVVDLKCMVGLPGYTLVQLGSNDDYQKVVVDLSDQESGQLSIRSNDIFVATAWWTFVTARELKARQSCYFGNSHKLIYLIQDHEPDFYGWSTNYGLAQLTYRSCSDVIAILNSEELAEFMRKRYEIVDAYVLPYTLNSKIASSIVPAARERIILIYARPNTPRNAFNSICAGLSRWQKENPSTAKLWKVVAAGESFPLGLVGSVENISSAGKLSLEDYGALLSKASVGISLMLSPHPSYPPLEMAFSGLQTITNTFDNKNLSLRSSNIISIEDIDASTIAGAISTAVLRADAQIGQVTGVSPISRLSTDLPDYTARALGDRISQMLVIQPLVRL